MNLESPEIQKEQYEYQHFDNETQREDIFFFTKHAIEYLETLGECSVVFMDRAARPAYAAFDEYWNIKHPDNDLPKPKFYFVNPKGFITNRDWLGEKNSENVLQEIEDNFPSLMKDKDKPLILIDACVHFGTTFENVGYHFEKLGFKVKCLVANIAKNHSDLKFESKSVKSVECDIFGASSDYGNIVERDGNSIISKSNVKNLDDNFNQKMSLNEGIVLRKEIRQIIREGLIV